jgi:hypothetical protein
VGSPFLFTGRKKFATDIFCTHSSPI